MVICFFTAIRLSHDRYCNTRSRPFFHKRAGSENKAMFVIHDWPLTPPLTNPQLCQDCVGSLDPTHFSACVSLDCPVYHSLCRAKQELAGVDATREQLQNALRLKRTWWWMIVLLGNKATSPNDLCKYFYWFYHMPHAPQDFVFPLSVLWLVCMKMCCVLPKLV